MRCFVGVDGIFADGKVGQIARQVLKELGVRHGVVPDHHPGLLLSHPTLVVDLIHDVETDQLWIQVNIVAGKSNELLIFLALGAERPKVIKF